MSRLIGLTGYAGSGKDTVAETLILHFGFVGLSFADALKELAVRLDPPVRIIGTGKEVPLARAVKDLGWDFVKHTTTARDFVVALGAGAREILGEDVWLNVVKAQIMSADPEVRHVVTDVRYKNEADMVTSLGGRVYMVDRPGVTAANLEESNSIAEIWPCAWILNHGTVGELRQQVINWMALKETA